MKGISSNSLEKKPSSLILKLVTCLSQSQSKKKRIIAQVDDEVSRRGKKESDGP